MLLPLLVLLFLVPFLDLYLLFLASGEYGIASVVLLSAATAIIGGSIARRAGSDVLYRISSSVSAEEISRNAVEGGLVLFGAVGLLIPGLVTDAIGAAAIFRPFRQRLAVRISDRLERQGGMRVEFRQL